MNGISRLTAMMIAEGENLIFTAGGPDKNGKYMGWITLGEDRYCRPLLNSEAIYDSLETATQAMLDLKKQCREFLAKEELLRTEG
jgi:hypothetical protein